MEDFEINIEAVIRFAKKSRKIKAEAVIPVQGEVGFSFFENPMQLQINPVPDSYGGVIEVVKDGVKIYEIPVGETSLIDGLFGLDLFGDSDIWIAGNSNYRLIFPIGYFRKKGHKFDRFVWDFETEGGVFDVSANFSGAYPQALQINTPTPSKIRGAKITLIDDMGNTQTLGYDEIEVNGQGVELSGFTFDADRDYILTVSDGAFVNVLTSEKNESYQIAFSTRNLSGFAARDLSISTFHEPNLREGENSIGGYVEDIQGSFVPFDDTFNRHVDAATEGTGIAICDPAEKEGFLRAEDGTLYGVKVASIDITAQAGNARAETQQALGSVNSPLFHNPTRSNPATFGESFCFALPVGMNYMTASFGQGTLDNPYVFGVHQSGHPWTDGGIEDGDTAGDGDGDNDNGGQTPHFEYIVGGPNLDPDNVGTTGGTNLYLYCKLKSDYIPAKNPLNLMVSGIDQIFNAGKWIQIAYVYRSSKVADGYYKTGYRIIDPANPENPHWIFPSGAQFENVVTNAVENRADRNWVPFSREGLYFWHGNNVGAMEDISQTNVGIVRGGRQQLVSYYHAHQLYDLDDDPNIVNVGGQDVAINDLTDDQFFELNRYKIQ